MTDATVRLNGTSAGRKHHGGFYQFNYDVTSLVRFDAENVLEVEVDETSEDPGVNRAERTGDYWNFGGIFRPVWLEVVPAQFIERIAVDAQADGRIAVHATVNGEGVGRTLRAQVYSTTGKPMGEPYSVYKHDHKTVLEWKVSGAAPWTAETPELYRLEVDLIDAQGVTLHRTSTRIGFRTFAIRPGEGLFLNGSKIVLQGTNRHSFNALTGRALSEADHRTDIELMKGMNMNAVRMSHYPPDPRFLELCDELGLYVLDELAGWQKAYDTISGRRLVEEMVVRDVNHPSILFWDNGNEGGWNRELDHEFSRWDPQVRPVLHPWHARGGINTAHYKSYVQSEWLAKGFTTSWNFQPGETPKMGEHPLIYMPTEFIHGLFDGGGGAGLEDYWTMMRSQPTLGGGFLWAFRDEGLKRPDNHQIDVRGNAAPDGVVGPFGEKEASYYTIKELWTPLVVSGQPPEAGSTMELAVENRYSFIDASRCRFAWSLNILSTNQADAHHQPMAEGSGAFPKIAPGSSGSLKVALPDEWRKADVLSMRVEDPQGRELWTYSWPLPGVHRLRDLPAQGSESSSHVSITEDPACFDVRAGDLRARFDRSNGMLTDLSRGEHSLSLGNGPRPAAGEARLVALVARRDGSDAVISGKFEGALNGVEWRVRANGWIDCTYSYRPLPGSSYQGVRFDYPEASVRAKSWIGNGPYRVWQNRTRGVSFGRWSNAYNDTVTGWSGWEYPEFKGCFAAVRWLSLLTTEGTLQVVIHSDDQFVQVLKPGFPPDNLQMQTRIELPDAGLAFLDVIPAIGTKFSTPESMGPQGQPPTLPSLYRHKISFSFEP